MQSIQRSGVSLDSLSDKRRLALIKMLDEFKTVRQEIASYEERLSFLEGEFENPSSQSAGTGNGVSWSKDFYWAGSIYGK